MTFGYDGIFYSTHAYDPGLVRIESEGEIGLPGNRPTFVNFAEFLAAEGTGEIGEHIALGHRTGGLRNFAQDIGANHLLDVPENAWKADFLNRAANPSTKFSVSLNNFFGNVVKEMVENEIKYGVNTEWELQQPQKAGRLGKANFFLGGKPVPNPFTP